MDNSQNALWLVYDGDCPFCAAAARMYRLRQAVGHLHIVNAREIAGTPLMAEIEAHHFDLNTGIVARYQGKLHHGRAALHLLAQLGDDTGWLNATNRLLFRHRPVIDALYPAMVTVRNLALKLRGKTPI